MARVLVTRPQPGAGATAAALVTLGHEPVLAPLMETVARGWTPPELLPDAVMLTSTAAVRLAGPQAEELKRLPALCVGERTAAAAQAAGWTRAEMAGADLVALMAEAGRRAPLRLLHLCGEDRASAAVPAGVIIERRIVYAARLEPLLDPGDVEAMLVFSPRSAAHLANEWDRLGRHREAVALVAISPAAAEAAGAGWGRVAVAATPDEASLLAALAMLGL
jgi:uroporphyrinogen-III synthase